MQLRAYKKIYARVFVVSILGLLTSCATPPPPPPIPPSNSQPVDFDQAAAYIADSLSAQMLRSFNATGKAPVKRPGKDVPKIIIVVDAMIDGASGQHTSLSSDLQRRVAEKFAASHPEFSILPFTGDGAAQALLLMVGTISLEDVSGSAQAKARSPAKAQVAVIYRSNGIVAAQATVRITNDGFDITPNKLEQDSPVLLIDRVVRGYIASAATAPGQLADPSYTRQMDAAVAIAQGAELYNQGRYAESSKYFQQALADPSGEQLRALNGSYLSSIKLGRPDQAEKFFGRIVALGIDDRNLGVKFLFNPGTTTFWSDPQVSGAYGMWLKQIARGVNASKVCVEIVGHASRTGVEAYNVTLSEQRAALIRNRLLAEEGGLRGRMTTKGVGSQDARVGTGTDDARDAVDRRVSFDFKDCR